MYKIIVAISEDGYIADINGNIPWQIYLMILNGLK